MTKEIITISAIGFGVIALGCLIANNYSKISIKVPMVTIEASK